jgi:hypothetical protein
VPVGETHVLEHFQERMPYGSWNRHNPPSREIR